MSEFAEHGIRAQSCLFGQDGHDEPDKLITTTLRAEPWTCVIVGVGVGLRKADNELELFERVINLVRKHARCRRPMDRRAPIAGVVAASLEDRLWVRYQGRPTLTADTA